MSGGSTTFLWTWGRSEEGRSDIMAQTREVFPTPSGLEIYTVADHCQSNRVVRHQCAN